MFKNKQTNDKHFKGTVLNVILNVIGDEFILLAFWDGWHSESYLQNSNATFYCIFIPIIFI